MKVFAYIPNGIVLEIIKGSVYGAPPPEQEQNVTPEVWQELVNRVGKEIPIQEIYTPEFISTLVEVTDVTPEPVQGMSYQNGVFSPPAGPTAEQIKEQNKAMRDSYLRAATLAIGPLQDAVDLDDATDEDVALLKAWKQYRVSVNRVDLTLVTPAWPPAPAS
ncbi:tail fiber assembly protein [Pseudomonas koreensis]|uniref:Caudovirales tail fiber assembly protein n=1 Tax=Pseudomonas koreensis TaxID=198620 RepID=A0AA94ENX1_9PSED|nr:tail fiber assembly protein [Pseudomonas koreensis]RVD76991.1 Caudovirales tail fiber assembly protein [Pseudomonas koreensis]